MVFGTGDAYSVDLQMSANLSLPVKLGTPSPGFYKGRLIPRMQNQFQGMGSWKPMQLHGGSVLEDPRYDQMTQAAERGVQRATQRALEDFLLQDTVIGHAADVVEAKLKSLFSGGSGKSAAGSLRAPRRTGWEFGFGISSALPELEIEQRLSNARLQFGISAGGVATVEYGAWNGRRTWVKGEINPFRDEYRMGFHFGF